MIELGDQFHFAASGLNFGLGAFADAMDANGEGDIDFPTTQERHRILGLVQHMGFSQQFRGYLGVGGKAFELFQVDFVEVDTVRGGKALATDEGQAAVDGQVAALAIELALRAGAGGLAFGTTAGGFTLTSEMPWPTRLRTCVAPSLGIKSLSFIALPVPQL